jgi:hypothetical protein
MKKNIINKEEIKGIVEDSINNVMKDEELGILQRDEKILYMSRVIVDLHVEIERMLENKHYYESLKKRKHENQLWEK